MPSTCTLHNWAVYDDGQLCPYCAQQKVPRVIRDAERLMKDDVKSVAGAIGQLFFGDGLKHFGVNVPPAESTVQPGVTNVPRYPPVEAPDYPGPVHPWHSHAETPPTVTDRAPSPPSSKRVIDTHVAGTCATCGGMRRLGEPGHQVDCPACAGEKVCLTCRGRGTLGLAGHEVECPACAKV